MVYTNCSYSTPDFFSSRLYKATRSNLLGHMIRTDNAVRNMELG